MSDHEIPDDLIAARRAYDEADARPGGDGRAAVGAGGLEGAMTGEQRTEPAEAREAG